MAEYNMTYDELKNFIDESIELSENKNDLAKYKAEILAALTANVNSENSSEMKDMLSLWQNQIGTPSEILLGTRYIRIKDCMVAFIGVAFSSGLMDVILSGNPVVGMTVGVASGVVYSLIELFTNISSLDELDFCIYMQAVCHFKAHKFFTKDNLLEWFPHDGNLTCNMHNSKWDCDFLENDNCSMIVDGGIERAIESLVGKGLLIREHREKQDFYKFPY